MLVVNLITNPIDFYIYTEEKYNSQVVLIPTLCSDCSIGPFGVLFVHFLHPKYENKVLSYQDTALCHNSMKRMASTLTIFARFGFK